MRHHLLWTILLAACGSNGSSSNGSTTPSGGSAALTGSVAGVSLASVQDSFGVAILNNGSPSQVVVLLSDTAGASARFTAKQGLAPSSTVAGFSLVGKDGTALAAGTYPLTCPEGQNCAVGGILHFDKDCVRSPEATMTAGSITLTTVTATSLAGSFTATYDTGSISGTFNVPVVSTSLDTLNTIMQPADATKGMCSFGGDSNDDEIGGGRYGWGATGG